MASNTPPSSPGSAPESPSEETLKSHFGDLIYTSQPALITLGKRIRKKVFNVETTNSRVVTLISNYFSLGFILELDDTKMAIRIPACGRVDKDLTGPAEQWLQSHVQTLKYVRAHTTIPVPEVYAFDTTAINEILAPYVAMSYTDGRMVSDLWVDENGPTPLETRRRRILQHLAQFMSELHAQRFNKIGSLLPPDDDNSSYSLGPCFGWDFEEDGLMTINSSASFESSKAWVQNYWAPLTQTQERSDLCDGCYRLLNTALFMVPDQNSDFALAPYNIDWQTIMADEMGNITELVSWENSQTTPDFLGCLRYPIWIVRNLDPANRNSDPGGHDNETKRQEYRDYYLEQIKVVLATQDPTRAGDYTYTAKSNAAEGAWVAYTNPKTQVNICQDFVEEVKNGHGGEDALPLGLRETPLRILENLGGGRLQQDDKTALAKGLKVMMGY